VKKADCPSQDKPENFLATKGAKNTKEIKSDKNQNCFNTSMSFYELYVPFVAKYYCRFA